MGRLRLVLGMLTLIFWVLDGVALYVVADLGPFWPQIRLRPYSDAELLAFGVRVRSGASWWGLAVTDTAFTACFALWAVVSLAGRVAIVWVVVLPAASVASNLAENLALVARLGLSPHVTVDPALLTADPSPVYYLTLLKTGCYGLCLTAVLRVWLRRRRAQR